MIAKTFIIFFYYLHFMTVVTKITSCVSFFSYRRHFEENSFTYNGITWELREVDTIN